MLIITPGPDHSNEVSMLDGDDGRVSPDSQDTLRN